MLDEEVLQKFIPEVYSRLCMMDEEFAYEIDVPGRHALLGICGGGKQTEFRLVPILLEEGGSRRELPAKIFTHRTEGTITVAVVEHPNIRVISIDEPRVELYDWLRSDPWSAGA